MREKYGFVYLWYDRKHKRYYIGCHWGHEQDSYVCSSRWMKAAYKRRPRDFKRRIIERIYTSKIDMFAKEYHWLCLISDKELGNRYYNLSKKKTEHWAANPDNRSVKEKLRAATLASLERPEVLENKRKGYAKRILPPTPPEQTREANLARIGLHHTEEAKQRIREQRLGSIQSEETKAKKRAAQIRVSCLCCKREYNKGAYTVHLNIKNRGLNIGN